MEKAALSINRRSAGLSDTVSGVVRLSAGEAMAVLVARHLPGLRARLQQIEFEVVASHTLANLSRREADLLIREQVPELAGIVTRKLCRVAYAIYAARKLTLEHTAMPALVDMPWIGFDDDHSYMPGQHWLQEQLGRRPEIRVNNWLILHEAARSGAGLAVLPCYLADQEPRLRRVGGVLPEVSTEQWLLVHRDLRALPGCGPSWMRWSSSSSATAPCWKADRSSPVAASVLPDRGPPGPLMLMMCLPQST